MIPTDHLLVFVLTAFALIVVPGPSVLFVVSRSVELGRKAGLATVVGNASGEFAQVAAVALGIGAIVEGSVAAFTIIKLAGAAYLIYLGVQAVRHRTEISNVLDVSDERKPVWTILRQGFVVGVSNPKSTIFFAAVLPQFTDRAAGHVQLQLLLLGAIFIAIALLSDGVWALVAGTARAWLVRSPHRLSLLRRTGGLVMIGLGIRLALSGRSD
jgi:threonine/homoserine/homoserine lactone efflux protein